MTQISQMYEEEKIEYGNQRAKEAAKEAVRKMAEAMLDEDIDIVKVMKITGLEEEELLHLQDVPVTV